MRWFKFQRGTPKLRPMPWTGRTRRKRLPEITTTVKAKSAYGIKVQEDGDWWNWSKPEYRGEPFNTEVQKGDRVQITYGEKEYQDKETGEPFTKYFITTIEKVTAAPVGHPLVEEFPPDERITPHDPGLGYAEESPPSAAREPVEASEDYGQSLWAKDRLRARTDCLACATGIYKSVIEAGIYKEFPSAETVANYAATLEVWAKSE